jgi:AraC-like DNA-binding protein
MTVVFHFATGDLSPYDQHECVNPHLAHNKSNVGDHMDTLVRAAVLTNYFEVAGHLGLNPQPLLANLGLSRRLLENTESRISLSAAITLLEESARQTACASFGLRMAETRQLAHFGVVSLLLTHQATLRESLLMLMQYQHLLNESLAIHIEDAGKLVILHVEVMSDAPIAKRQGNELAIGVLFRLCTALLGQHWHPVGVTFTHSPPDDLKVHQRLFRCKLEFDGGFNGIACLANDIDRPNPIADPGMVRNAVRLVDSLPAAGPSSTVIEVRKALYVGLPMGRATIEQVALALNLNVRTLQRRLEDSAHSFTDLINEVRRELALRYMDNPRYQLGRVAELLGYSVLSSFTRWFKAQFGITPEKWRERRAHRKA